MNNKEIQAVHDWSSGSLEIYEIEAQIGETSEPPTNDDSSNS